MAVEFKEFLDTVPEEEKAFVVELDELFRKNECVCDIKDAKNGYMVSYYFKRDGRKVTVINFVFRKIGVKIRIYAAHIAMYQSLLDTLPEKMKAEIKKSGDCKRLIDPTQCNSRCQMGFDFYMDGERYKKCRNMAFLPTLNAENDPYIRKFVENELQFAMLDA